MELKLDTEEALLDTGIGLNRTFYGIETDNEDVL